MLHMAARSVVRLATRMNARALVLRSTLGFLSLEPSEPELQRLHRCFDTWRGIGDVVAGMTRQEYDLEHSQSRRSGIGGISRDLPGKTSDVKRGARALGLAAAEPLPHGETARGGHEAPRLAFRWILSTSQYAAPGE